MSISPGVTYFPSKERIVASLGADRVEDAVTDTTMPFETSISTEGMNRSPSNKVAL